MSTSLSVLGCRNRAKLATLSLLEVEAGNRVPILLQFSEQRLAGSPVYRKSCKRLAEKSFEKSKIILKDLCSPHYQQKDDGYASSQTYGERFALLNEFSCKTSHSLTVYI